MSRVAFVLALSGLVLTTACSADEPSSIEVVVSEQEPPLAERPDRVVLVAQRIEEATGVASVVRELELTPHDDARGRLPPWSTLFAPSSASDVGRTLYRFRATAYVGGAQYVVSQGSLTFLRGVRLVLPLRLSGDCASVTCGADETCKNAACVSDYVPPCSLVTTPVPAQCSTPVDGGPATPPDAAHDGATDAPDEDAEPIVVEDAATDATDDVVVPPPADDAMVAPIDAGTDAMMAPMDAGSDAMVVPTDAGTDAAVPSADAGTDAGHDGGVVVADAGTDAGAFCPGRSCDDGLTCTNDSCDEAANRCVNALRSGKCLIDGVCRDQMAHNPANDCQACFPSVSQTTWSPRTGDPCDDGLWCTDGDTCNASAVCRPGPARNCSDGLSCTSDGCNESSDTCTHLHNATTCLIAGVCYANGALNPANDCEWCAPGTSTTAWTIRADESPCGPTSHGVCCSDACRGPGTTNCGCCGCDCRPVDGFVCDCSTIPCQCM